MPQNKIKNKALPRHRRPCIEDAKKDTGALTPYSAAENPNDIASFVDTSTWIDTPDACRALCEKLRTEETLAVDIEGVDLSRTGAICIIQIARRDKHVFLFDVVALEQAVFLNGLKDIFESRQVTKLFFDCRYDGDALFYQYGVLLQNVLDLQILRDKYSPKGEWLQGLSKVLVGIVPDTELEEAETIKHLGRQVFEPKFGGSYEVWKLRPLPTLFKAYCAIDVVYLFAMLEAWGSALSTDVLRIMSERRLYEQLLKEKPVKGNARRDFEHFDDSLIDVEDAKVHALHDDIRRLQQRAACVVEAASETPRMRARPGAVPNLPREVLPRYNKIPGPILDEPHLPLAELASATSGGRKELTSRLSPRTGKVRVVWNVLKSTLLLGDRSSVSPSFPIAVGTQQLEASFKIMLLPTSGSSGPKSASFKSSGGAGHIQLKCETALGCDDGTTRFNVFIGNGCVRGPVVHDFGVSAIAKLPPGEALWDFHQGVVEEYLQVGLEFLPSYQ